MGLKDVQSRRPSLALMRPEVLGHTFPQVLHLHGWDAVPGKVWVSANALHLDIFLLGGWVSLSLSLSLSFPFPSCALLSLLPSLFFFFFFFCPFLLLQWVTAGPRAIFHPLAPAAASCRSDLRTGPSLWSLSAARAQHHPPFTRRSVQPQGPAAHACLSVS